MKTAGKVVLGALVLGGVIFGITRVAKAAGGSGGGKTPSGDDIDPSFDPFDTGDDPTGPGGGGGGGGGSGGGGSGGTLGPGGFRTYPAGEPNGGLVFGHMSDAGISKVDWNPNGNTVRFSDDCTVVLVGRQVWKMGGTVAGGMWHAECVEYADVKSCWRHGQNLCCRIDDLMNREGWTSAAQIGRQLLIEMEPPCIDSDYDSWPPAMRNFVDWLRTHVNQYVLASSGQADW